MRGFVPKVGLLALGDPAKRFPGARRRLSEPPL